MGEPASSAWERVQRARHPDRPHTLDFIRWISSGFLELHGDRAFGDDHALVGGLGQVDDQSVMLLGHQKGRSTKENIQRNFGSPRPEGFRKAMRLMRHAEKFGLPVITFIDTPGASPDPESEARGQAWAIAESISLMCQLRVPIVSLVTGEGNSGGALAIGVADRIFMLENAYFSVVSPEGCASILWRDAKHAPRAAEAMRISAADVLELGVIDRIIPEPGEGAHTDGAETARRLKAALAEALAELRLRSVDYLLSTRHEKYRRIGVVLEATTEVFAR
jgi:acetyl-CoA carboxylase carboxyl transferase subunit alpha